MQVSNESLDRSFDISHSGPKWINSMIILHLSFSYMNKNYEETHEAEDLFQNNSVDRAENDIQNPNYR